MHNSMSTLEFNADQYEHLCEIDHQLGSMREDQEVSHLKYQNSNNSNYALFICVSAQRKGPSVGIFISKKIRFYKAVQNFLRKIFFVNLLIIIVYYVYIDLYIHIFISN